MNCQKCNSAIGHKTNSLKCVDCSESYHLSCLTSITKTEFDFLKSSGSNWKCEVCIKKKVLKGDETPVTPTSEKVLSRNLSANESENDSEPGTGSQSQKCNTCKKGFSYNAIRATCISCKCVFHFKCCKGPITKEDYLKVKSSWKCSMCGHDSSSGMSVVDKEKDSATNVTLADILSEMIAFRNEVKETNKDFTDSMEKYSQWITENTQKIDEATKSLSAVVEKYETLYQENINLKKTVSELNSKLSSLAQSVKANEVEVNGVPYVNNEDLIGILRKISTAIGFDFNENMVDKCYRYKRAGVTAAAARPGGIVVRFVRNIDLQNFVHKRKEKLNLNTRDLGFMAGDAMPVYVNSCLTADKRKLLNAARQVKKEKLFTYLWVKDGRIFMRKNQGDRYVVIESTEDLEKLA